MPSAPKILLVDSDDESRALLRWTLARMYPGAVLREASTLAAAMDGLHPGSTDVALVHRAADADATRCVRAIREARPALPILVLSASELNADAARAAGATDFLRRDEWLRIRTRLDQILLPPR